MWRLCRIIFKMKIKMKAEEIEVQTRFPTGSSCIDNVSILQELLET